MRKRNPVVVVILGFAALLAVVLVLGSVRRAQQDPTSTSSAASVALRPPKGMPSVRISALPREAQRTLELIASGGPFPNGQDGAAFQNREGQLPSKASDYYHEYTVETPGSSDRGARRIVQGASGERYYTDDHYVSFRWVVP